MKLVPITQEQLKVLVELSVKDYSRDMFICGELMNADEARENTLREINHFIPEGLDTPNMAIYTVYDEETFVGYLWYSLKKYEDRKHAFLTYIHVEPELRGKGYAKKMMELYENDSKERFQVDGSELAVFIHNKPAVNLYEKGGYRVLKKLQFYQSKEPKRYLMYKKL